MPDLILDIEQAKYHAFLWSVDNQVDAQVSIELTAEWFAKQKLPVTPAALGTHLRYFHTCRMNSKRTWDSHADEAWAAADAWSLETVKHLAIVNVAGIAGSVALIAMPSNSSRLGFQVALASFIVGAVLALLDLWVVGSGYTLRARGASARASKIQKVNSWATFLEAENEPYVDKGKDWFEFAELTGWTSAICVLIGGVAIFFSLF